jgi:acyl carrier protein
MANEDICGRVIMVLAEYISDRVTDVDVSSSLVNDLGMDSLELTAIAVALESEFAVRIPDDTMSETLTVGELAVFIESRLSTRVNA